MILSFSSYKLFAN